ncbi:MAG: hypothetical protein QM722_05260 [Piscinibacter sp.]
MNILDNSLETDFGCPLRVYSTSLAAMPAMTLTGPGGDLELGSAPVLVAAAPLAMVRGGRRQGGSSTRHGWLRNGHEMVGVMMAHLDQHFAATVFDLAEPLVQEMTRVALLEGRTRFMLRHETDELLVTPELTLECRLAFEEAQSARPAALMSFMRALASLTRTFSKGETFAGMGLDPRRIESVSLSMCTPAAAASDTQLMEAAEHRRLNCH